MATGNCADCKVDSVSLNELKEQTVSVLKNRLRELKEIIFTRKSELTNVQRLSVADLQKELAKFEKDYAKLESKIADLEHAFDESQDISFLNSNQIKTVLLILAVTGLTGGLGYVGLKNIHNRPAKYIACSLTGLLLLGEFLMFYFSETIALVMSDAKTLDKEKYAYVYGIVENLAQKAGIPKPKVFYNKMSIPNAFACGRNRSNASVLVTQGLLDLLNEDELRAVLAHEISHIRHYDTMLMSASNAISTPGLIVAQGLKDSIYDCDSNRTRGDLLAVTCYFLGLFSEWTFKLMNLSISRSREYLADESGAKLCADPIALASALNKLRDRMVSKFNDTSNFTSSELKFSKGFETMCIASPFKENSSSYADDQDDMNNKIDSVRSWIEWVSEWFSTHPLTKNRVIKLKQLEQQYVELLEKGSEV
ncbi:MAG: M48 family metalloprotease [bacterium]